MISYIYFQFCYLTNRRQWQRDRGKRIQKMLSPSNTDWLALLSTNIRLKCKKKYIWLIENNSVVSINTLCAQDARKHSFNVAVLFNCSFNVLFFIIPIIFSQTMYFYVWKFGFNPTDNYVRNFHAFRKLENFWTFHWHFIWNRRVLNQNRFKLDSKLLENMWNETSFILKMKNIWNSNEHFQTVYYK